MKQLLKDSGLHGLKASVGYCAECRKPQVHYTTANGWPVCHVCGYNAELAQLFEGDLPISARPANQTGSKAA